MIAEAPLFETLALVERAERGDTQAAATLRSAFSPETECFLCGRIAGRSVIAAAFPSPYNPRTTAMLIAVCGTCKRLSPAVRAARAVKICREMWPARQWTTRPTRGRS
jgi:hypothetical protein